MGDPLAAMQAEHGAAHAGEQFHVLDGSLGDPTLVHGQGHDFAPAHERHDDLHQFLGGRVVDELHVFLHGLFRDLLRHHQLEHSDEQLDRFRPLV